MELREGESEIKVAMAASSMDSVKTSPCISGRLSPSECQSGVKVCYRTGIGKVRILPDNFHKNIQSTKPRTLQVIRAQSKSTAILAKILNSSRSVSSSQSKRST